MWTPKGDTIPSLPWKDFQLRKVLMYYDGPRLELLKSKAGQWVLAWWLDGIEDVERWLLVPASEARLVEVLSGLMPTREALEQPEEGHLYLQDLDTRSGEPLMTMQVTASGLDPNALPMQGARLDIPLVGDILRISAKGRAHHLITKIEPAQSASPFVPAKVVGQFLSTLQRLVDSIGQANEGHPTMRAPIPIHLVEKTRLNPIAGFPGSFTFCLETEQEDDMFGESLVRRSLESLFALIDAGENETELSNLLRMLRGRVAKNYDDLLTVISASADSASIRWHEHGLRLHRQAGVSAASAQHIRQIIALSQNTLQEYVHVRGKLQGGNVRTLRFELVDEKTGERISGAVDEMAEEKLEAVRFNSLCDVTLTPRLDVLSATGEERTSYTLVDIHMV
ncbi:MAG: hypothetical protein HY533_06160 [Chloroflexi bacterium]|nr:hypothetical protein [Chloroflexota bacterium]